MAFSITSIGTRGNLSGATAAITYTGGNISGVWIGVSVAENSSTIGGSVADNHSTPNSYSGLTGANAFMNNASGNGFGNNFYAENASLDTNDVITYTKQTSGNRTGVTAYYVTGAATSSTIDAAVTNKATGSSTTPSVTGGTAGASGGFNIATLSINVGSGGTTGFSQDTGNGWAAPPNEINSAGAGSGVAVDGGSQTNSGTAGLTFAPTITSHPWAAFIFAIKPAPASSASPNGWFPSPDDLPKPRRARDDYIAEALTPSTLPVKIAGMAWFEPPERANLSKPQYTDPPAWNAQVIAPPPAPSLVRGWQTALDDLPPRRRAFPDSAPFVGLPIVAPSIGWLVQPQELSRARSLADHVATFVRAPIRLSFGWFVQPQEPWRRLPPIHVPSPLSTRAATAPLNLRWFAPPDDLPRRLIPKDLAIAWEPRPMPGVTRAKAYLITC